jgi:hypothetical protein
MAHWLISKIAPRMRTHYYVESGFPAESIIFGSISDELPTLIWQWYGMDYRDVLPFINYQAGILRAGFYRFYFHMCINRGMSPQRYLNEAAE